MSGDSSERVSHPAARRGHAHELLGFKGGLVEVDGISSTLHEQVGRGGVEASRNGLRLRSRLGLGFFGSGFNFLRHASLHENMRRRRFR